MGAAGQGLFGLSEPGENGRGVIVPPEYQEESRKLFQRNRFNQWASDRISLHRSLPDARILECSSLKYPIHKLPQTSVIIVFHNEAWSTLLRTVHSVLDRSPPELLREIILVDDSSDHEELHSTLEKYVAKLSKVKIVRNKAREGLIRSRLNGFAHATSPTVTFLDAHCEANVGWLEPLLYRIMQNRTIVVCPEIDVISDETFEYTYSSGNVRGSFNWNLNFRWKAVPEYENKRRAARTDGIRSPTMAGGLFTIHSQYFKDIGLYDKQMEIWGGENLELSFRIWQCGGQLEIIPCSHVGHVFRKSQPYSFPKGTGETLSKNLQRVAEVWMDGYKRYFYKRQPHLKGHPFGDISKRLELRKKLKCKNFDWYIKNVVPEIFLPNSSIIARGELRNPASGDCIDSLGAGEHAYIGIYKCHKQMGNQYLVYTKNEEIIVDDNCFDYANSQPSSKVKMLDCHSMKGNQQWLHTKVGISHMRHAPTGWCLDRGKEQFVVLNPCNNGPSQKWLFSEYVERDKAPQI
ncbi:uncharacterized protein TRIADDRAFT_22201 [Trichoplax adhaerens]|uniref:Polypeptide N-acetylgalactosaminyltransferase n=1 Tax=Trichoplax adhaerens TaxID=10228 RepID=B3RQX7_TRIAD|nr:hypothetical protein TRIADDRAFT_22201 [Trichoplax adhaerens]EDV26781.1 hypothetical protein TRIADDRAFT_22201 [Trichoplax adhaerens]|eukprot:XP_002110777.1 hypothetical protein TRIADDRAFT_22201 [Trichoplax adhaerens]